MRMIGLFLHHLRFISLSFWRNPSAAFFGIIFPVMILLINSVLFGSEAITIRGVTATVATFYVAGMSVFAVVMTCFTNLATAVLFDRDMGRLKRIRATPTPVLTYVVARLFFAMWAGLIASMLCIATGVFAFHVTPDPDRLWPFVAIVLIGGASLAAVALAVVGFVSNAQAGPAVLNAVTFPIVFVSNVFYPIDRLPGWLLTITGILPIRPFASAATGAFFGAGIDWKSLGVVIAWGVAGALIAMRNFRWEPRR